MRDWREMVHERIDGIGLSSALQEEVVAELAAHLQDRFELECALGLDETAAISRALDEVDDWQGLARKIHRAKHQEENMNHRTKSLWIPGLVSLTAAMASRMLLMRLGVEPRVFVVGSSTGSAGLELYLPWLMLLPLVGAIGAYLSRRADGQRATRLAAALFPAIVLIGLFILGLTVSIFFERGVHARSQSTALGFYTLDWIVLPGACLLIGALPFLRNRQEGEVQTASR